MGLQGKTVSGRVIGWAAFLMLVFGCGQGGTQIGEVDGIWRSNAGQKELSIQLKGDAKSITYGGDTVPVEVKTVENNRIILEAKTATGGVSEWKLLKVWNDNGSAFSLKLFHGDKIERFVRKS